MKLIKVNGNTVATAVKTKSGVFNMQLGINEYSDESLDRFIKYLKVYGKWFQTALRMFPTSIRCRIT